ncbi:MAG: hypothetical protein Pg6C_05840 [Treponemataceae bacterium]|nr:MAG: hypothetical protein Pg6C_05840 [Treponemataceae bacterium]
MMEKMTVSKKRFLVCCKSGHVGRASYIEQIFPVRAASKAEAAAMARFFPSVKHGHKDAILWVRAATREEFVEAKLAMDNDPYWQGARHNGGLLVERLLPEPNYRPNRGYKTNIREFEKDNKKETRIFRLKRNRAIETEINRFIASEYGL